MRRFLTRFNPELQPWGASKNILIHAFTAQLKLSNKHITHLQEELRRAQSRIDQLKVKVQDDFKHQTTEFPKELMHIQCYTDQLEAKAQDQIKMPNEVEQEIKKQVEKLQEALAAAECDKQELKAVQKHLVNQLQSANIYELKKKKKKKLWKTTWKGTALKWTIWPDNESTTSFTQSRWTKAFFQTETRVKKEKMLLSIDTARQNRVPPSKN